MKKTLMATSLVCALAALPAFAQEAPKPAPELAQLKGMLGTWTCDGDVPASPFGPAHKTRTTVKIHEDLDGFWVSGSVKETKTADNPMPVEGKFHQTWDTASKQYLMIWVDNFGVWATETSKGWEGDKMSWSGEGSAMGKKIPMKDHFTKKGENELAHTWEMSFDGKWATMGTETCKRVPGTPKKKK